MWLFYGDESGNTGLDFDDVQQPVYVHVAVGVAEDKWQAVEDAMDAIAQIFLPHAPTAELHAVDCHGGRGPFRGVTTSERRKLAAAVLALVTTHELKVFYLRVRKPLWKVTCLSKSKGLILPQVLAVPLVAKLINDFLGSIGARGILFFDEQTEGAEAIEIALLQARRLGLRRVRFEHLLERPHFVDSRKARHVQLADFVAYYLMRHERAEHLSQPPGDEELFALIQGQCQTVDGLAVMTEGTDIDDVVKYVLEGK